jgi:hypothetical protein
MSRKNAPPSVPFELHAAHISVVQTGLGSYIVALNLGKRSLLAVGEKYSEVALYDHEETQPMFKQGPFVLLGMDEMVYDKPFRHTVHHFRLGEIR